MGGAAVKAKDFTDLKENFKPLVIYKHKQQLNLASSSINNFNCTKFRCILICLQIDCIVSLLKSLIVNLVLSIRLCILLRQIENIFSQNIICFLKFILFKN